MKNSGNLEGFKTDSPRRTDNRKLFGSGFVGLCFTDNPCYMWLIMKNHHNHNLTLFLQLMQIQPKVDKYEKD